MRVIELKKKTVNHKSKAEVESMIKAMRKEDEKMVKGQFEFVDAEGGFFEFTYKFFPGDNIKTIQLLHGEICEIPMGIVKHLNNTKQTIRRYANVGTNASVEQNSYGQTKPPRTVETKSRVRFVPMEYI